MKCNSAIFLLENPLAINKRISISRGVRFASDVIYPACLIQYKDAGRKGFCQLHLCVKVINCYIMKTLYSIAFKMKYKLSIDIVAEHF